MEHRERTILLVLCGLPASGKTTLGRAVVGALAAEHTIDIVSTDSWRDDEYYSHFTPENEHRVRRMAYEKAAQLLLQGQSVIHDDTNYYVSMRHELMRLAMAEGCLFGVVYVNTPLDVVLRWNKKRDRAIPRQVILQIVRKMDIPGHRYAWDRPVCVVNMSQMDLQTATTSVVNALVSLRLFTERAYVHETDMAAEVDTVTRRTIAHFLRQNPDLRNDLRVHTLRRSILQRSLRERLSPNEATEILIEELKRAYDRE